MGLDPTQPDYIKIDAEQWAQMVEKVDLLLTALNTLSGHVRDLADLNFVVDRGSFREEIFGRFKEAA